jgi:hypothetical protein
VEGAVVKGKLPFCIASRMHSTYCISIQFHDKWAQGIVTQGWGKAVRCRILGRSIYGREPTEEECKGIEQSGRFKEVTKEEVKDTYFSGHEVSSSSLNNLSCS